MQINVPVQYQYAEQLGQLVEMAESILANLAAAREAAAKRGHLSSLGRAEALGQQLSVELCELQVTAASQNILGRAA
jgi:hypothetical protein